MLFQAKSLAYIPILSADYADILTEIKATDAAITTDSAAWTAFVTNKADGIKWIMIGKNGVGSEDEYDRLAAGTETDTQLVADITSAEMYFTASEIVKSKKRLNDDGFSSQSQMGVSLTKENGNLSSSALYQTAKRLIEKHYINGERKETDYESY